MDARVSKNEHSRSAGHRGRLRERFLEGGASGFHDYELIEYLLTLTIPRVDTKPLAKRLIDDFGGIGALLGASADSLRREGLTDAAIGALKIAEATALRMLETRIEGRPAHGGDGARSRDRRRTGSDEHARNGADLKGIFKAAAICRDQSWPMESP
jgi:DNA repair protein RadC